MLLLMLPVTLSLGLINFNLLINSIFGSLVRERAPAAIDKAFRIYMLPQGIFSVAVTTVLFPTLARLAARREYDDLRATMANGMRQIVLLLVPAAAAILVLSVPMIRLVYQRGEFTPADTDLVATALFWFAFSLPFNGLFLLLTRTFFSLQRPWVPTAISGINLAITAIAAAGALLALRGRRDRRRDRDRDGGQRARADDRPAPPARAPRAGPADLDDAPRRRRPRRRWRGPATASGTCSTRRSARGLGGQIVSLGAGLGAGAVVYAAAITALRIPEAQQIWRPACARPGARAGLRASSDLVVCAEHDSTSARPPLAILATLGRHGPHPQLLDHRPHRPRQVDACRPVPRADRGGRRASTARSCSTRWSSSASAGSRSRLRRCGSTTGRATARPTTFI